MCIYYKERSSHTSTFYKTPEIQSIFILFPMGHCEAVVSTAVATESLPVIE